jgi:hypothetical protein
MKHVTPAPRVIVVGNEKGGAGKSTIAIHLATALMHAGARVATIDLDLRQLSMAHFFEHRRAWAASAGASLPMPEQHLVQEAADLLRTPAPEAVARFEAAGTAALQAGADFLIVDTPGADTPLSRAAHANADLIVTPLNDSFVDFDMLGEVDPVTLDLIKPGLYSEVVWESRKNRMAETRRSIDWLVHPGVEPPGGLSHRAGPQGPGDLSRAVPLRPDGGGPFDQRAARACLPRPCGGAPGAAQRDVGPRARRLCGGGAAGGRRRRLKGAKRRA